MGKPRLDRSVVWQAPPVPARARQPRSDTPLPPLTVLEVGPGPEDVVLDDTGNAYTGLEDGNIIRADRDLRSFSAVAHVPGKPDGLDLLPDGRLLVCACGGDLLAIDTSSGKSEVLVHEIGGKPMLVCNNPAVAPDGTIYFTDSSQRFDVEHWRADLYEHSGTGRLIRRDPTGAVEVLMDGLQYANGVALVPDNSAVLVAETGGYRIQKYQLSGPRAGTTEPFVELPGLPDNLSTGSDGLIWVALPSSRDKRLDFMLRTNPLLRKAVWALPQSIFVRPKRTVWVQAYNANGRLVHDLQDSRPEMSMITGVRESEGRVFLGSLQGTVIACFDLPAPSEP